MPQLLHYLKVDAATIVKPFGGLEGLRKDGALDWGTLAIYTCTQSCGEGGNLKATDSVLSSYLEEAVWRQDPLT